MMPRRTSPSGEVLDLLLAIEYHRYTKINCQSLSCIPRLFALHSSYNVPSNSATSQGRPTNAGEMQLICSASLRA